MLPIPAILFEMIQRLHLLHVLDLAYQGQKLDAGGKVEMKQRITPLKRRSSTSLPYCSLCRC